jgi:glycosyltransferase involved in cell wall biosynthesis
VLVIDGGSNDETIRIAKEFGARIIFNPLGHATAAKWIGYTEALGDYVCFVDQDERLVSEFSLSRKLQVFEEYPNAVAALTSGYLFSEDESPVNRYASEFGDPLSLFRDRTPNHHLRRIEVVRERFRSFTDPNLSCTIFDIGSESRPTLLEIGAAGGAIARRRILNLLAGRMKLDANSLPMLLTILGTFTKGTQAFILTNDPVSHKTASTWGQVFSKVRWRVSNATEDAQQIADSGFTGRVRFERLYTTNRRSKHWFKPLYFVLYVICFVPVFADSLFLAISRKRPSYMMNVLLAYYVIFTAFTLHARRVLRIAPRIRRYDGTPVS